IISGKNSRNSPHSERKPPQKSQLFRTRHYYALDFSHCRSAYLQPGLTSHYGQRYSSPLPLSTMQIPTEIASARRCHLAERIRVGTMNCVNRIGITILIDKTYKYIYDEEGRRAIVLTSFSTRSRGPRHVDGPRLILDCEGPSDVALRNFVSNLRG
ncbi:hypothetical protein CEXT_234781, partial [Caerostris extrusa]